MCIGAEEVVLKLFGHIEGYTCWKWREQEKGGTKGMEGYSERCFECSVPEHARDTVNWSDLVYMMQFAVSGLDQGI